MTVKRPSVSGSKKPAKVAKIVDPTPKQVAIVAKALAEAEVSPATRSLLTDALPQSLALLKDERHDFQNQVVDMVEQQLHKIEATIEAGIQGFEGEIAAFAAENDKREAAVTAAQSQHQAKEQVYQEKKHRLADIAKTFQDAKEGLVNAQDEQESGDAELNKLDDKVKKIESAAENVLAPLKEGTVEDAKSEAEKLMKTWSRAFEMDDSLVQAAIAALSKKIENRGMFDSTALGGLDDALGKALSSMKAKLAGGDTARKERADAVANAQAALKSSRDEQNVRAKAFVQAKTEMEQASQAVSDAQASVAQLKKEHKKAEGSLKSTQAKLASFREGSLATFCELRDRMPAAPVVEEAAVEEEAAPAAEDAEMPAAAPEAAAPPASPAKAAEASPAPVPTASSDGA